MSLTENKIPKYLTILLIVSAVIRGFLAAFIEFGNDEVYYWTYALYPDWSHFDHPGMIGWIMQLFSLNLLFDSEFALRLSSVIFMTIDTYLIYMIGCEIKNRLAGFYAALLYTASIYAFVITGIFIMPDTPLSIFMLLSIFCFVKYFSGEKIKDKKNLVDHVNPVKKNISVFLLLAGLFCGLAILSKYSGIFVWVGAGLYILIYDRKHLKNKYLYLSILISIACALPILIWNIQNDFISFTFHGDRVSFFGKIDPVDFVMEILGELGYNNPVNYVLIIIAIAALFKGKNYLPEVPRRFLLCFGLPFIGLFWFFSLTRPILPHWSAPAFSLMLLFPASYLSDKQAVNKDNIIVPKPIVASIAVMIITVALGVTEIKTGVIPLNFSEKSRTVRYYGEDDITNSIYGWRSLKDDFQKIRQYKVNQGLMKETDDIVALKWFPLATFDYYIAQPLGINMMGLRDASEIHKYTWINDRRGGLKIGADYWFLTESSDYYDPDKYLTKYFNEIIPCDTITVERCGKPAKYVFVYMCRDLKSN